MKRGKFYLTIFILILLFGSSCQKSIDNYQSQIDALTKSVNGLQKRCDSLSTALSAINGNMGSLSKSVDSIKSQLNTITVQITNLNIQITQTNADVLKISGQIAALTKQYNDLLNQLNSLILQYTNTTAYLNSRIDSLNSSIKVLQLRTDSTINALRITNNNVSNLSKSVDTIRINLSFILTQISQLSIQLNTTNANYTLINAQINLLIIQYNDLLAQLKAILAQLAITSNSISNGLILWMPFTGNTIDSSGNGNNGTNQGAILSSDRFGNTSNAYRFGLNKNIIISSPNADLNLTGSLSISTWFYMDSMATTYNASMLLSKHDGDTGNDGWTYGIWNPNNNTTSQIVNFQMNNQFNTNTYPGNSGIVSAKKWYHFVTTYDLGNQTLKYYLDGNLITTKTIQFNVIANTRPITIGYQRATGAYLAPFVGSIDDIRIYNRVLSLNEVQYLATH